MTQRILKNDLTARLQSLEEEVVALRSRVAKLEERAYARQEDDDMLLSELREGPPPVRMGRRPLLTDQELLPRLEGLVMLLEGLWPYFEAAIEEATNAEHLATLLRGKLPNRDGDTVFRKLFNNYVAFWDFVTSDRFNHTPQQVACAMAGVPEMEPRTSLDRCAPLLRTLIGVE